jgi:peptidoglycan/LPS O-acetylase OafA/YrhL
LLFVYPFVGGAKLAAEAEVLRQHQWWIWLHMSNWLVAKTNDFVTVATLGTGGFWSLAIEEQYYLIWPLLVLMLSTRQLLRTCIAIILGSLAVRLGMVWAGASWTQVFTVTFARMDSLAIGGALAIVAQSPDGLRLLRPFALPLAACSVLAFAGIEIALRLVDHPDYTLAIALQFTLLTLFWAAVLIRTVTAAEGGFGYRFTNSAILRSFGKYSFALYLFHGHVYRIFRKIGFDPGGSDPTLVWGSVLPRQLLYLILALGISYALAFLSWHLYEKHFLRLKVLFPSGHAVPAELGHSGQPPHDQEAFQETDMRAPLPVSMLAAAPMLPDAGPIQNNSPGDRPSV